VSRDRALADAGPRPGDVPGAEGGRPAFRQLPVQAGHARPGRQRLGEQRKLGRGELRGDQRRRRHPAPQQPAEREPAAPGPGLRRLRPSGGPARGQGHPLGTHAASHTLATSAATSRVDIEESVQEKGRALQRRPAPDWLPATSYRLSGIRNPPSR
jgi:hypothetical protein